MRAHLSRRFHFSASHRLHTDSLSAADNQATFGKCNNPFGHGHNYMVEVTFSGRVDPHTGMVANLSDLDAFAQQYLLGPFDQVNLNTLDLFHDLVPTTENLSVVLHGIFQRFPNAHLERLHVEETANNSFDFAGEALPPAGRY